MKRNTLIGIYAAASLLPFCADVSGLPFWGFVTYYAIFLLNLVNVVRLVNK